MGIFDMISNTVEGVAQVALSPVKATIGLVVAPLDDGETVANAAEDLVEGARKIGSAKSR
jgi:hypothetical protein